MKLAGWLFFLLSAIFLLSTGNIFAQKKSEIIIYHTNDMHGQIENFPKLAYLIEQERINGKEVLLLNSGDIFSGNPAVDMYPDKGYPMIDLMNDAGYTLSCIGNHEFDVEQPVLQKRIDQAAFQFICANFTVNSGKMKQPAPTAFYMTKDSIRIAFLGLIENENNGLPSTHPLKVKDIEFKNGIAVANNYNHLKSQSNCYILLSHLGIKADSVIAQNNPQIDFILGGHSHTCMPETRKINNVVISQTAGYLNTVMKISISFTDKKLTSYSDTLIYLKDISGIDTAIQKKVTGYKNNPVIADTIGYALYDIAGKNNLGSLMTDAITSLSGIDAAFINNGGIRIDKIPQGPVTKETIYRLDPFFNNIIVYRTSIKEIKMLIKNSYHIKKELFQVSGLCYKVTLNAGKRLIQTEIFDKKGNVLPDNKILVIGVNSYLANSYLFHYKNKGFDTGLLSTDLLINYIKHKKTLDYTNQNRFTKIILTN